VVSSQDSASNLGIFLKHVRWKNQSLRKLKGNNSKILQNEAKNLQNQANHPQNSSKTQKSKKINQELKIIGALNPNTDKAQSPALSALNPRTLNTGTTVFALICRKIVKKT